MYRLLLTGLVLRTCLAIQSATVQTIQSSTVQTIQSSTGQTIQSSTVQSLAARFGLRAAEFEALMENSWEPKARTRTLWTPEANETSRQGCHDTQPGSLCYHAVEWLHDRGLAKYPSWYPSLSEDSTMQEVQSVLHTLGKASCPKPCHTGIARRLEQSPDDRVLEVDGTGRQVLSEAYELSETTDCGDVEEGDWCSLSIQWLKNTGLSKHPDWYPTLTHDSSIEVFQTVLHRQGKMGCPLPCSPISAAPEPVAEPMIPRPAEATAVVTPQALREETWLEDCEDAKTDSSCDKAISRVLNTGLWLHPEEYPELSPDCSRAEVQEHLFLRGQYECGRPCPKAVHIAKHLRAKRVKKKVSDMTAEDLTRFLNREWDGYVDSDEYEEYEEYEYKEHNASERERHREEDAANKTAASAEDASNEQLPAAAERALPADDESAAEEDGDAGTPPAVGNETVQGSSEAQGLSSGDAAGECRDTKSGELCYQAITWARTVGIFERPQWYAGLSALSTLKEFQAHLHKTRGSLCPMPCLDAAGASAAEEHATAEERATLEENASAEEGATVDAASPAEAQSAPPEEPAANDSTVAQESALLEPAANDSAVAQELLPMVGNDAVVANDTTAANDIAAHAEDTVESVTNETMDTVESATNATVESDPHVQERMPEPDPDASSLWRPEQPDLPVIPEQPEAEEAEEPLPMVDDENVTSEDVTSEELLPMVDVHGRVGENTSENASEEPLKEVERSELEDMWSVNESAAEEANAPPVSQPAPSKKRWFWGNRASSTTPAPYLHAAPIPKEFTAH